MANNDPAPAAPAPWPPPSPITVVSHLGLERSTGDPSSRTTLADVDQCMVVESSHDEFLVVSDHLRRRDPTAGTDVETHRGVGEPYLCGLDEPIPSGWVRGDPFTTLEDRPAVQVAYNPARYVVVRCAAPLSDDVSSRLHDAGFRPLGGEASFLVRDRFSDRRPVRPHTRAASMPGRSL